MYRATRVAVLAICIGACASSAGREGDSPGASDGADSPAGMTGFVVDLIDHHTADDALPVAYEQLAAVPDPDGDANDLGAYAALFRGTLAGGSGL